MDVDLKLLLHEIDAIYELELMAHQEIVAKGNLYMSAPYLKRVFDLDFSLSPVEAWKADKIKLKATMVICGFLFLTAQGAKEIK